MEEHVIDAGLAREAAAYKCLHSESDLRPREEMPESLLQTASSIGTSDGVLDSASDPARAWRPKQRPLSHPAAPSQGSGWSSEPSRRQHHRGISQGSTRGSSVQPQRESREPDYVSRQHVRRAGRHSHDLDSAELEIDSALSTPPEFEQHIAARATAQRFAAETDRGRPAMTHAASEAASLVPSAALQLAMLRIARAQAPRATPGAAPWHSRAQAGDESAYRRALCYIQPGTPFLALMQTDCSPVTCLGTDQDSKTLTLRTAVVQTLTCRHKLSLMCGKT